MLKSCKREIGGGSDLMSKLFGEHQNKNISSIVVWSVIFILRVSNAAIRSEFAGLSEKTCYTTLALVQWW